ncbi:MAG: winged helix-turn-helix transcriptional regulator [Nanoarchaeota archaeon]|nr:winged helix-turn-helix transcriptional regulator [Nanoarchaeota archaeon]
MEAKLTILGPFFENPQERFSLRALARKLGINHTTVRQQLNKLVKEEYLSVKKEGVYSFYALKISVKTLNLKLYYNLEKLRKSGLIEALEKTYDYPVIILFGSYSQAMDATDSDVDICIITNVNKDFETKQYERKLGRKISLHRYSKSSWEKTKKNHPHIVNSICNGNVLSGEFEVL